MIPLSSRLRRALARASAALVVAVAIAGPAASDPRPPEIADAARLRLALRKLQVTGTALYVGAHPDDENTAFLSWLSNGRLVRTGYLSMTRGDGGQNLIGSEAGEALGVLRTQELLAARRIDGAEQFFTRALDYGFSKSPDEALAFWDHDRALADVVWVIRRFRPDVVVARFPTDGGGGHGHHTASAILAGEAFRAAADPKRFPEQLARVRPWQAKRLVWNVFRAEPGDTVGPRLVVDVGAYEPLLGRSHTEIAGQSRSMHKSQGFGSPERRGSNPQLLRHLDGEPARSDLFDGVELGWRRIPGGERVGALLADAERRFDPDRPEAILPTLLAAREALDGLPSEPIVEAKRRDLAEAIRTAAGLWVEAIAASPEVVPGGRVPLTITVVQRSSAALALEKIELPFGAVARFDSAAGPAPVALRPNVPVVARAVVALPDTMPISQPYWLRAPHTPGSFTVADAARIGDAENPPVLLARLTFALGGKRVRLDAPVVSRWVDPVAGERYRDLVVVPPVTARLDEPAYLFPDRAPRELRVVVESADTALTAASARLVLPAGWRADPARAEVRFGPGERERSLRFTVTPGDGPASAAVRVEVEAGGKAWSHRRVTLDHDHVPLEVLFPPAEARLVRVDLRHTGATVGYVMGSGDQVPAALRQMGYRVTLLSDDDVESGDLQRFDAIVTGVRAYNTRPRLRRLAPRLLEYVRAGGRLVVQYLTPDPALNDAVGPYPFTVSRDRVAVETAEMRMLAPEHPLLSQPNRIGPGDFSGWVQERGLDYANPWDPRYETVLAANDPNEPSREGGLLYASLGKGAFVYTGLAWFRQLPAGVPGAYRLFANLVSAPGRP